MAVPNGYDLFEHGWPKEGSPLTEDYKNHPLYPKFLEKAKEQGFDTDSGGFEESEESYFLFFLLGADSTRI